MELGVPAAFFAGAGLRHLLDQIREHRTAPRGLPDLLGWLHLVGPSTVLQKDGSFLTGWSYRGPDLASATHEELNSLSLHLHEAFLPYGDGWMFHFDFRRRPAQGYAPVGAFPDPVTRLLDEERREAYLGSRSHFVSESFLTATYLPPRELYTRLASLFVQGYEAGDSAWGALYQEFEAEVEQLERRLAAHLKISRLDGAGLLTHLHISLTGLDHSVRPPAVPAYLDALLADQQLTGGWTPRIGTLSLRVVSISGFPHESFSGILDFLGSLGFGFRIS
ncbi:MAG: conjugal transfer protein TrbE, partial [Acidobacteriota bacterium]|nr:conjugal transfer protein TrbE [Acidobacteriota bacterium]